MRGDHAPWCLDRHGASGEHGKEGRGSGGAGVASLRQHGEGLEAGSAGGEEPVRSAGLVSDRVGWM